MANSDATLSVRLITPRDQNLGSHFQKELYIQVFNDAKLWESQFSYQRVLIKVIDPKKAREENESQKSRQALRPQLRPDNKLIDSRHFKQTADIKQQEF